MLNSKNNPQTTQEKWNKKNNSQCLSEINTDSIEEIMADPPSMEPIRIGADYLPEIGNAQQTGGNPGN